MLKKNFKLDSNLDLNKTKQDQLNYLLEKKIIIFYYNLKHNLKYSIDKD